MFVADCAAALALTLAASEWQTNLWVMQGPDRWAGNLTRDLAHWAESGVEDASGLAALLQAEYDREERKSSYYDGGFESEADYLRWEAEMSAAYAEADAAAEAERVDEALWRVWDYEVTDGGRVLLAA